MDFKYSSDANALYIYISDHDVARTVEVDEGTLVDLADDGSVVGIEVIAPSTGWPIEAVLDQFGVSEADAQEIRRAFADPAALAFT